MLRCIKFDAEIAGASNTPYTKIEKEKWNFGIGEIENGKIENEK